MTIHQFRFDRGLEIVMEYRAVTKYLGEDRAEVKIRDLTFTVDERVSLWREGARFCPIELVLASLAS
jgi:hypothetical protein